MGLRIFANQNTDGGAEKSRKHTFADDIVGRFRSGYQTEIGRGRTKPVALSEWRVTTGDPEVAKAIAEMLDGDEPQEWPAQGEDNLEVFTKSKEVQVVVESPKHLRQRLILWGRNGKIIRETDGVTCSDGTPDPDADKPLAERKQLARDGVGPAPQIDLLFRLADDPDLGVFKFQSGSWSLASDLDYFGVEDELADIDGPALVRLGLEEVSFVAKSGPRAGQTVSYTKPTIKVEGPAEG